MATVDAWDAMQGNEYGLGKGLTTYPNSADDEGRELYAQCLALEREGKAVRAETGEHPSLGSWVRWMPVESED